MNDETFKSLVKKLESHMINPSNGLRDHYISPIKKVAENNNSPNFIFKDMCLDILSKEELQMLHTNLHRFYPRGTKTLSKITIEQLHNEVKKRVDHQKFDMLDKIE